MNETRLIKISDNVYRETGVINCYSIKEESIELYGKVFVSKERIEESYNLDELFLKIDKCGNLREKWRWESYRFNELNFMGGKSKVIHRMRKVLFYDTLKINERYITDFFSGVRYYELLPEIYPEYKFIKKRYEKDRSIVIDGFLKNSVYLPVLDCGWGWFMFVEVNIKRFLTLESNKLPSSLLDYVDYIFSCVGPQYKEIFKERVLTEYECIDLIIALTESLSNFKQNEKWQKLMTPQHCSRL